MATCRMTRVACVLSAAVVAACGSPSPAPAGQASPSPSPSAPATLASMSAQPGDLPALGLTICPHSGPLGDPPRDGEQWKGVQALGAQEAWFEVLRTVCSGSSPGLKRPEVVNDLVRFKDSSAAEAFFAHERAHAKTDAVLYPYKNGTTPTEGAATGLGPSAVTVAFTNSLYCSLWIHGSIASSYCSLYISRADFKKGALAVDARIPS